MQLYEYLWKVLLTQWIHVVSALSRKGNISCSRFCTGHLGGIESASRSRSREFDPRVDLIPDTCKTTTGQLRS